MARNIQIREPGNNYADVLHPETNTDMVLLPDGVTPMTAHLADYVLQTGYATTTGSANNYAVTLNPAPASLVEGLCVAVKIHVTNTGTSTLNVNGKGAKTIKKPNGNNLVSGNLKAGSIYTVRYNGTNFILQGSDSTGNATPEHVLAGKTFSNDAGTGLTGTMPNRGAVTNTITTQGGSYTIPQGYHNGSGKVTANFVNLVPENIRAGVNIGGVVGTLKPVYYASGFTYVSNYDRMVYVTGLGFKPKLIIVLGDPSSDPRFNRRDVLFYIEDFCPTHYWSYYWYDVSTGGGYINDGGFHLQLYSTPDTGTASWRAWGWD